MRASYENLIQQAKTKLIRTFLDREKRRQNQNIQSASLLSPQKLTRTQEVKS